MLIQILSVLEPTIISILGIVVSYLGTMAVKFILVKKEELEKRIGMDEYNHYIEVASHVWNFVEEEFRIKPILVNTIDNKIKLFDDELLKRIPYLTESQIMGLRQSIAGEVNKSKQAITGEDLEKNKLIEKLTSDFVAEKEQLQMQNQKLAEENQALQIKNEQIKESARQLQSIIQ